MAGKRQHVIPQFLQEGFASHAEGSAKFAWVYRKGAAPFNANIVNVGVEREFYTRGTDTEVDDLITDAEGTWASLVHAIRNGEAVDLMHPEIPIFLAHLEVRTRHIRRNFQHAAEYLVSQFLDFMSDEAKFGAWLERRYRQNPSLIRVPIAKALKQAGIPARHLPAAFTHAERNLKEFLRPLLPPLIAELRERMPQTLKDGVKSGHISALRKTIPPHARARYYKDLIFSSVETPGASLILGDAPMLFRVPGPRPYKAFLDKDEQFDSVVLPLSPTQAIIGSHSCVSQTLPPDLRRGIARCSLEYFIAAEHSQDNIALQGQIGEDAAIISTLELEEIVARGLAE